MRKMMVDRRMVLAGVFAFIATESSARGCWRPNGWCRRAQRRREEAARSAVEYEARQRRLDAMTPKERMQFLEDEKREREQRHAEYLQREKRRKAEIAERERIEKLDRDRRSKFWKEIGFFLGLPLVGVAVVIVGTKVFGVNDGRS